MWAVIQQQAEQIDALEQRVADLETATEKASTARTDLAANAHEANENAKTAREISKAATAKVSQLEAEIEDETNRRTPLVCRVTSIRLHPRWIYTRTARRTK